MSSSVQLNLPTAILRPRPRESNVNGRTFQGSVLASDSFLQSFKNASAKYSDYYLENYLTNSLHLTF
jgi:hypothetical protein